MREGLICKCGEGCGYLFAKLPQFTSYPSDINRMAYLYSYKNRVGDDGVPAILQYRSSDLYPRDMTETMTIYPHSSPHLQIRPSLVHPFLP